jgi:NTE family protein
MWRKSKPNLIMPRVGLALSGGAARGIAHIGVLRVFEQHKIPIDFIAGTSAGALVGGAFAAGMHVDEIEEICGKMRWRDMGRITLSRLGIQSSDRMESFLRSRLPVTTFEDLQIPFAAVATDIHTGTAVIMKDDGDLPFAIRASCSVPGWYVPVTDKQGRQLVDGGLVANIPSGVARSLGADIVIAVDVNSEGAKFLGPPQSVFGVLLQTLAVIQRTATAPQWREADLVVTPQVGHIRWDEMGRADELIAAGEQAALRTLDDIKQLLEPPKPQSKWYQVRRRMDLASDKPHPLH